MESQPGATNRKRVITACLTCRHRKVKCDHAQPVCSPCKKGNRVCTYTSPQSTSQFSRLSGNRVSRSNRQTGQDDIRSRLERLEQLLERALSGGPAIPQHPADTTSNPEHPHSKHQGLGSSQNPQSETLSTDGYDGALLLDGQGGQSRWIRDVKMLLGGLSSDAPRESLPTIRSDSPIPFLGPSTDDLRIWAPTSADTCLILLDTFYSHVDPMTRIVHKPTLKRRLIQYIDYTYGVKASSSDDGEFLAAHSGEDIHAFEPLALAVFYSAINSLSAEDVLLQFPVEKEALLSQFQHGVQIGLGRENLLTTPSIEVLQAFVLLLTCQSWEDDMAKTWTLLESRGQEPTISDDDFTTFLPRNISDENLVEGGFDGTSTQAGFTDMTVHLIRLMLEKSVNLIESLNTMPDDKDAQRFEWHIGGHACFQPIMHIVSELDMPDFDVPNRQALRSRALDALKKTMHTRGREVTPMWNAMNRIISNCLAKSTSRHLPVTLFQAARIDFSVNETTQGLGSSATESSPALLPDMPISREFASSASLPDFTALGSIEMLEPDIMFDWGFWNIDSAAPGPY
ncbi:hypothetical protein FOFC_11085 [Fusarium oxysporum]|nr:hypothetical protein FOFC_11085 [Fusarium oxysporum]